MFYRNSVRIELERKKIVQQVTIGFEAKASALHSNIVAGAREEMELETEDFLVKARKIADKVYLATPTYEANYPKTLIRRLFPAVGHVSVSTAGLKLKKIARI